MTTPRCFVCRETAICILVTMVAFEHAFAQTTRLTFIQPLGPSLNPDQFFDISADGSTAVGISADRAVRWNAVEGLIALPLPPESTAAAAHAVSADGSSIAVTGVTINSYWPFRWHNGVYTQQTSATGPVNGQVRGISADGSLLVGCLTSTMDRPVRWRNDSNPSQMTLAFGYAYAANSDGSIVVGMADSKAFRWTAASGTRFLPTPPLNSINGAAAFAISADGSTIVGVAAGQAAIWINSANPLLTSGPWNGNAWYTCNEDGSVVAGEISGRPAIWTAQSGTLDVRTVLLARGISDLTGSLVHISGIAADGTRMVGYGYERLNDGSTRRALIILDLPICPGDFNRDYFVDLFDYLDFVSAFAAADPSTDLNTDGIVDFFDYLDFVDRFRGSC